MKKLENLSTSGVMIVGFLILVVLDGVYNLVANFGGEDLLQQIPEHSCALIFFLAFAIMGMVMVKRREVPIAGDFVKITGTPAIIIGTVWTFFFLALIALGILSMLGIDF